MMAVMMMLMMMMERERESIDSPALPFVSIEGLSHTQVRPPGNCHQKMIDPEFYPMLESTIEKDFYAASHPYL